MKAIVAFSVSLGTICYIASMGCAASLWTTDSQPLIGDRRASRVGDIVTVVIVERSSASHKASHEADKSLEVSGDPGLGLLGFFPRLGLATERETSGAGGTTQTTQLVDRVSGLVSEVTAAGMLRVEAERQVRLNSDEVRVSVSGLVRPDDVRPDNTVLSTCLAECRIEWSGRGPIPGKQKPGLLSALLSLLW